MKLADWLAQDVTPLPATGKVPLIPWRYWQDHVPTQSSVDQWFSWYAGANTALVCGNKLAILDFDDLELYRTWAVEKAAWANTYTVATPRPGRHVYFWVAEEAETIVNLTPGIDVKGRNSLCTAAGSVVNGKRYIVVKNVPLLTVANISETYLANWTVIRWATPIPPRRKKGEAGQTYSSTVASLKGELDLLVMVQQYTELQPSDRTGRWYIGKCPLHDDTAPSLRIDTVYQKCFCWSGCFGKHGGDVVDFYAKTHHLNNRQAIRELAKLTTVTTN
jgi:hypothetical protein